MAATHPAEDVYSASATVIIFHRPLPLLRRPISVAGTLLLAFETSESFAAAVSSAQYKLVSQCEAGAMIGCALSASARCRTPWWRFLFGGAPTDFAERARCEERETSACFESARENCVKFARGKCAVAFREARVVVAGRNGKHCRGSDLLGDKL